MNPRFHRIRSTCCEKGLLVAIKIRFSSLRCIRSISVDDVPCKHQLREILYEIASHRGRGRGFASGSIFHPVDTVIDCIVECIALIQCQAEKGMCWY